MAMREIWILIYGENNKENREGMATNGGEESQGNYFYSEWSERKGLRDIETFLRGARAIRLILYRKEQSHGKRESSIN